MPPSLTSRPFVQADARHARADGSDDLPFYGSIVSANTRFTDAYCVHPHLGTTLWTSVGSCELHRAGPPPSTAGPHGPPPGTFAVHTAPHQSTCADAVRPHNPQHLLLLLMFSLSRNSS